MVLAFWGLLGACEKKEIPTFTTDDTGIYFQRVSSSYYGTTTEFYSDSLSYSFLAVEASARVRCFQPRFGQWVRLWITTDLLR